MKIKVTTIMSFYDAIFILILFLIVHSHMDQIKEKLDEQTHILREIKK